MSAAALMSSPQFLRNVLRLDALSCAACGLLQVLAPAAMAGLLGLPQPLLAYSGEFLLVYAAFVGWLSARQPMARTLVWLLVVGNLGWALACVAVLFGLQPTALGISYGLVQVVTVVVLADLQYFALRRQTV